MGTWGHLPWDNDKAADWFGDTFDHTKLAQRIETTLQQSVHEQSAEEIRAAAAVVILLGRTYIWPIYDLDRHLALAADRLQEIKQSGMYADCPEIEASIDLEIQELRNRIKESPKDAPASAPPPPPPPPPRKKWWEFWQ
ncbi:MAG: DUF4259 domain-containing protein [Verrucomicrobiota bacterium]